ncbi:MAG: glutamyl-tRNA amidotransferase [Candidatus Aquicultor primus]|uniref:Glutamyl-tRNA amidotransferase n=1 Tax=Candidatus Aquicultor primus TaxID=1797195 RepID=A0A1F2UP28_9ACTN|nr:MAG: glutamyl-tRNA amidotransferase [Candidatus Aquicultor primus]HCG99633.1 glutamyl-tRNA amidotransferase [Actinomycetota bacterium]
MSLKDRLNEDMKSAMRQASADPEQKLVLSTIRLLMSELKNAEIVKKESLVDDEVIEVVQRQIKRRNEAVEQFRKGNREELAVKEEKEAAVLAGYLPEQLSDEELTRLIKEAIEATGATAPKDMGRVMGKLMPQVKGKADGKRVNQLTLELMRQ